MSAKPKNYTHKVLSNIYFDTNNLYLSRTKSKSGTILVLEYKSDF